MASPGCRSLNYCILDGSNHHLQFSVIMSNLWVAKELVMQFKKMKKESRGDAAVLDSWDDSSSSRKINVGDKIWKESALYSISLSLTHLS
ncbi:unnamed protein product [Dovyalis caffra]|uniref:Uncharacterized protein n=1 Tax=Dovyalis caffra TaxID=77055 RepID=A0AAV1R4I6_9ROSI|nr:unnamed protein product [Dovyalis caffra]